MELFFCCSNILAILVFDTLHLAEVIAQHYQYMTKNNLPYHVIIHNWIILYNIMKGNVDAKMAEN